MDAPASWNPLPPPELSPGKAIAQVVVVVGVLYGIIYGGAALEGYGKRFEHPVASVGLSAVLMVLLVALFSRRDPKWRQSLSMDPKPVTEWLLFGAVGFAASYGANIVLGMGYLIFSKVTGGDPMALAHSKAQWTSMLADIPLPAMLALAAMAGIWEEIVFRGFVLGRVRAALHLDTPMQRDVSALMITSIAFGFGHGYQGGFGLIQTTLAGVVLGWLTLWRRSLWPAMVTHVGIDAFGLIAIKLLKPMLEKVAKGELPG